MVVFGLVHGNGWEPPDTGWGPAEGDQPERTRREFDWSEYKL